MNTIALNDTHAPRRQVLSMKAILAIGFLAAFTILLIWRASVLETRLIRESEEPALVDKPAPEFFRRHPGRSNRLTGRFSRAEECGGELLGKLVRSVQAGDAGTDKVL